MASKDQLEKLVRVLQAQRSRFARNLHDGPTQSIAALTLRINYLRRLMETNPDTIAEEMLKLEDSARQITTEMRYLLFTLQPLVLESAGLIPALKTLAEKVKDAFNIQLDIQIDNKAAKQLDDLAQQAVFYITEDYLTGLGKQAQGIGVKLALSYQAGKVILDIRDKGSVLSPGKGADLTDNTASLIRAWADPIQAELIINTEPGNGTQIQVIIPIFPPP